MQKRFLSAILALCMTLILLPTEAFGTGNTGLAEPQVTKLTVSFDGGEPVELLGDNPKVTMPEGGKPVFAVTFDKTELLNQVFVTSTKDGETKYLEARPQGNQYVTEGYFDPNDTNYIPGTIAVTYSKRIVKVDESDHLGSTDLGALKAQLSAQGISIKNEVKGDDGTVTAQVVLGDTLGSAGDVYFDAAISEFTAEAGIDQAELKQWLGVYQNLSELSSCDLEGVDGKKFKLYLSDKDFGDTDTYLVMVKDVTSNKYTRMLISKAANGLGLGDVAVAMKQANLASSAILDYNAITKDMDALREEVAARPDLTEAEKAEASAKIDALERDKKLFLMGMTVIPLIVNPVGAPLMISALLAGYSAMAGYFWEHRIGMIEGCKPIDGAFSIGTDHGEGWRVLTNESLKENNWCIEESGKYYLGEDISTITVCADVTICLHGNNIIYGVSIGSGASCTWRLYDCQYSENEDGTVRGGTISDYVSNNEYGSTLHIGNCIIDGSVVNYGTTTIAGGMITSVVPNHPGIKNAAGTMNITGGTITGSSSICISNAADEAATLNISSGLICNTRSDAIYCDACIVNNEKGTLNITGGTIANYGTNVANFDCIRNRGTMFFDRGVIENHGVSSSCTSINNKEGGTLAIRGGIIRSFGLSSGIFNSGETLVNSGSILAENVVIHNEGELTVRGGTTGSTGNNGSGILNLGTMTLSGGTVKSVDAGIQNGVEGILRISGGTVKGRYSLRNNGIVTISKGRFLGYINDYYSDNPVTLLINEKSAIEISTPMFHAVSDKPMILEADAVYSGGVRYYNSAYGEGARMTIAAAAEAVANASANYEQYLCLIADDAATMGDINEDGAVNTHDALLLQQYLTNLAELSRPQLIAADMDGSEEVDMKDIVSLAQKLLSDPIEAANDSTVLSDPFTVDVADAIFDADGYVEVPVRFSGCNGIAAFRFLIDYDADFMELLEIVPANALSGDRLCNNLSDADRSETVITWYSTGNQAFDGTVFTLRFRLKDLNAQGARTVSLAFRESDICTASLDTLPLDTQAGRVNTSDYVGITLSKPVVRFNGTKDIVTCTVISEEAKTPEVTIIAAFYDTDNKVITTWVGNDILQDGKEFMLTGTLPTGYKMVKFFLLSKEDYVPFCEASYLSIGG